MFIVALAFFPFAISIVIPRWLIDRWPDSTKVLARLLGFPRHLLLRKGSAMLKIGFFNYHPEHTASSLGMLALLVQWSIKGHPASWAASVEALLHGICARILAEASFDAELSLDREARCCPGLFAEGRDRVDIQVVGGKLQMHVLYACAADHPLASAFVEAVKQGTGGALEAVPLSQLVRIGYQCGRQHLWWTRQLLVVLALALDNFVPTDRLSSNPVELDVRAPKGKRKDPHLLDSLLLAHPGSTHQETERLGKKHGIFGRWAARAQGRVLVRYFLAMRAQYSASRVICVAVDGSRVGATNTYAGMILAAKPGETKKLAAWLPPQDPVLTSHETRFRVQTETSGNFRFLPVSSGFFRFRGPRKPPGSFCGPVFFEPRFLPETAVVAVNRNTTGQEGREPCQQVPPRGRGGHRPGLEAKGPGVPHEGGEHRPQTEVSGQAGLLQLPLPAGQLSSGCMRLRPGRLQDTQQPTPW